MVFAVLTSSHTKHISNVNPLAIEKRMSSGVVSTDQRGKHEAPNKIGPLEQKQQALLRKPSQYFKDVPVILRECTEKKMNQTEIAKQWLYAEIFNTD
nr:unnamed protein product [Callosobruchus chinensis]